MRNLWQFKKKYGGRLLIEGVDIRQLIPSRPFVQEAKVRKYMLYYGEIKDIGIIEFSEGKSYLIEGHHRSVSNYKKGVFTVMSKILRGTSPQLEAILSRINVITMDDLANNLR